ncbi:MAG: LmbE family N-acetylglucosaminyl deacetylase/GT2 family glycosyltransferase [Candidatus Paceibacteria bacterium]
MKATFPPLLGLDHLEDRVLCIAPHPDDEVIACGGVLALHAARGDAVLVVVLSASDDPDLARLRAEECRAGLRELGVSEVHFLGQRDGHLSESPELADLLLAEIERFGPKLIYAPSPFERHPDHRAAFDCLASLGPALGQTRALLWGVNSPAPRDLLVDTTAQVGVKSRALAAHCSQNPGGSLSDKVAALDRAATINVDLQQVQAVEAFSDKRCSELQAHGALVAQIMTPTDTDRPRTTAVLTSFNKRDDVRENLAAIFKQTLPFERVIVVDNASSDGTQEMIREEFPQVQLVVMPNSAYGACETFNVGFASSNTPLTAILDDDIVMPPEWLELATARIEAEPDSTAIVSTKVVEPGMPESYRNAPALNTERYMSTFRGCASLARTQALREAGFYDERLFIYGNERDLTCRLLNLGYRVLQYPGAEVFHKTPFGIKPGPRSLFYHARNAWLTMLKYAPLEDLLRLPFLVLSRVVLRGSEEEATGDVTDATGTIGIGSSLRETPGALGIVLKAASSVLWNLPYCLKHRDPVSAKDFELPLD